MDRDVIKPQVAKELPPLRLIHLYPDLLNLYGDNGNIIALMKRAERRGLQLDVTAKSLNDSLDADEFDIIFIGGGQDSQQLTVQRDLLRTKAKAIRQAAETDKVILAICGGYQLLGKSVELHNGAQMEGLSIIDAVTTVGEGRLIGDTLYRADFLAAAKAAEGGSRMQATGTVKDSRDRRLLVGFENHGSRTYLGPGLAPLATVLHGKGNNGEDGTEGARWKQVFCTYSHGSFLPKNPAMTDYLLKKAIEKRIGGHYELSELAAKYEDNARELLWGQVFEKS